MTRAAVVLLALGGSACGAARSTSPATSAPTTAVVVPTTTPVPTSSPPAAPVPHVMVVMMENKDFAQVIGQPDQPFTNSLARTYGLATHSYAFGHPSLPNYLDIVSGSNQRVTDDNPPSAHNFPDVPTVADQLVAAGFSAKAYAEDLPSDPTASVGDYAVRHVPWEYFPHTAITVVDASSLLPDLDGAGPPDFVWYTPNLIDDEHDGTVEQGDAFLARLVPEVQATPWYRADGEIIVEWDESDSSNAGISGGGGGHIPTIVISDALRAHPVVDASPVDTAGILRSIEDVYGLAHLVTAGDAANGTIDGLLVSTPVHPSS
jgi:phosphatidylinositol-3-phosphatase